MILLQNDIFAGRYRLEEKLGAGGFGEVWKAFDNVTHKYFAIKIHLNGDSEKAAQGIVKEYTRVMHIHHDNLLTPSHVDITDGVVPYLVMELCTTDLSDKDLDEMQVWHLIRDVAAGLRRLAENKRSKERLDGTASEVADPIIHQDIKPANILIRANGMYAISDFGISKRRLSTLTTNDIVEPEIDSAMTTDYAAPERFPRGKGVAVLASDIWSLGATLFEVVEGHRPFAECGGDCLNPTIGLKIPAIKRGGYSLELKQLIYDCMSKESANRPTAAQLSEYAGKAIAGAVRRVSWEGAPQKTKGDTAKRLSQYKSVPWEGVDTPPKTQEINSGFEYREPPTMYGAPSPIRRNIIKELIGANKKKLLAFFIVVVAIGAIVKMYPWMSSLFNYERKAWRTARQEDSYESYMTFIESNSQSKYVNDALLRMLRTKCTDENRSLGALRYIWDADTLTGRENTIEITDTIEALTSRWVSFARSLDTDLQNYSFEEDYSNPRNLSYLEELTRHFLKVDHMEMEILMFFSAQGSYRGYLSTQDGRCIYPVEYNVLTVQENIAACRDSLEAVLRISDNVFCRGIDKLNEGKFYTTQDYKPYYDSAISIVNHYFQIRNKDYGFLYSFTESMEYFCIIPDNADGAPSKPKNRRVVVEEAVETIEETIE